MRVQVAPRSLQSRLMLWVLTLAAFVWLGAALIMWVDARDEIDELLDGHLTQSAALLVLQAGDGDDDISDLPVLHKYVAQVAFQVFMGGVLVTRSPNVGLTPMANTHDGFETVVQPDGEEWRIFSTYSRKHDVMVQVGEKVSSRKVILWAVMRSMIAPLVFGFPLFALAVWWSIRQGLSPVAQLRSTLSQRAPRAVDLVSVHGMPRELRPLVHTLNGLFQRIAVMVESERRFTSDAAHELRTPIAAIRAQAQVALGAGDDEPARVHALQQTVAGCDRAVSLVSQLLTLARLESKDDVGATPVNLSQVVNRVADRLQYEAQKRDQTLVLQLAPDCSVVAEEVLLGVLVRNLIDNALRYSPNAAQVRVQTHMNDAGEPELLVQDSGPGMTDDAIRRLGERFFRVLGNDQPGSGLGWSIVCRLLKVFSAQVDIGRSAELGGLSVRVYWSATAPVGAGCS